MDWEGRLPLSSNRTGPFVSALTQVVLQLGQRPIACKFCTELSPFVSFEWHNMRAGALHLHQPCPLTAVQSSEYDGDDAVSNGKRKGDFGDLEVS